MTAPGQTPIQWPEDHQPPSAQGVQVKRWGLRTLAYLGLALVAAVVSSAQEHYNVLTALLLVIGLSGAAVSTVRGLKALYLVPPDQRAHGPSRR